MRTDRLYTDARRAPAHNAPSRTTIAGTFAAAWLAEAGAVTALALGSLTTALTFHGVAVLALAAVAVLTNARDGVAASAIRLLAITLPLFGPAAVLAATTVLLPRQQREAEDDARAWHAHLFPILDSDALADDMLALQRMTPQSDTSSTVAFRNVLQFGNLEQQEYVIALMSRMPRANFAPLFQEALGSNQPGVRAQAAAGLSLLEGRMNAQTRALRDDLTRTTDLVERDYVMADLARHLDTIAESGLIDAVRTFSLRTEALAIWQELASRPHGEPSAHVALGRELAALRQYDRARDELWAAYLAGNSSPGLLTALCDCLLQTHRLDDLRTIIQSAGAELGETSRFWLETAA